jgi:hypothetical protein
VCSLEWSSDPLDIASIGTPDHNDGDMILGDKPEVPSCFPLRRPSPEINRRLVNRAPKPRIAFAQKKTGGQSHRLT